MLISHSHRLVFVHVPKTGGDSVTAALRPYAADGVVSESNSPDKHVTASELCYGYVGTASWSQYFSFAFVRNPWDWLHSDYWFCRAAAQEVLQHPETHAARWVEKLRRVQKMDFADFVRTEWTNSPCRSYCQESGRDIVSFIGRYEDLQNDFRLICQSIGLTESPPLEHRNATIVCGRPRAHYRHDYTPQLRDLVSDRFAYEIQRFGYTF